MKYGVTLLFFLITFCISAQLPKWILGGSQQTSSGTFYTYGPGHLKFYEVNFVGSLSSTPRVVGTSIQNIKSMGTQDVMQTAVDTATNTVLFYAFAATTGAWNNGFPAITPDTVYFAAYNSTTAADEIFGKVPTTGWGASVIESELVQKPGSSTEYFFIYKTQATSNYQDYIRYVTIDISAKTVSAPTNIVTAEKSGEGMAVSQLNCSNQRWLFVTRPESTGNITLRRCTISNSGITPAADTYTISIPGNSITVVVGVEIAPTNNYLAVANYNSTTVNKNMILFDYNNNTGTVSNERYYKSGLNYPFVTMEFSPNGSRVYILQGGSGSVPNVIYNCPVTSSNYTVTASNQITGMPLNQSLTLETAYDGNIYVDPGQSSNFMYIISNPNSATPTITSTATNYFGSNDRIGSGFPDQVDGDKYPVGAPNVSIAAVDTVICSGQTTTLTAAGGSSYQWSGGSTSTSSVITVSPTSTSTYVVAASIGACTQKDSIVVQVAQPSTVFVNGLLTICAGQSTTLTATGANQYQWSGGSTASTSVIVVNPTTTTSYTVVGNNGGCVSMPVVVTVTVSPTPTVAIGVSASSLCQGQPVTLTASSNGSTYQWSGGSTSTSSVITVNPTVTTTYVVSSYNGLCAAKDSIILHGPSVLSATGGSACAGTPVSLSASGASSYTWSPASGLSSASSASVTANINASTTYTVSGTDANGCVRSATVAAVIDPVPQVSMTPVNASGCAPLCVHFDNTSSTSGNCQWNFGDGYSDNSSCSVQHCFAIAGTYSISLTLTGSNGCKNTAGAQAIVYPQPKAAFYCGPQPTTILEPLVHFTDISSGAVITSWSWSFGDAAGSTSTQQDPAFSYPEEGNYPVELMVTSDHGCTSIATQMIHIDAEYAIYVPNTFSPNSDGLNDVFKPVGEGIKDYRLVIYDRWGNQVFLSNDLEKGWDGRFRSKGEEVVQEDVYVWKIDLKDLKGARKILSGTVTLMK